MALQLYIKEPLSTNNYGNILTVEDNTGDGNTGWGTSGNRDFTDIDGGTASATSSYLRLEIIITDSDNNSTTYDEIDFYTYNNNTAPVNITDLVFELTPANLITGGSPLGTSEDLFPEGFYEFNYILYDAQSDGLGGYEPGSEINRYETYELIDTYVRAEVYNLLSTIPDRILNEYPSLPDWEKSNKILSYYAFLQGMRSDLSLAEKDRVLRQLKVLQNKLL